MDYSLLLVIESKIKKVGISRGHIKNMLDKSINFELPKLEVTKQSFQQTICQTDKTENFDNKYRSTERN